MFPFETSSLWRFLETVARWYPWLLLKFLLLAMAVSGLLWVVLLGAFRLRGHHFWGSNYRFRWAPGIMPTSAVRIRRSLTRRLLFGPPLPAWTVGLELGPRFRRLLRRFYVLVLLEGPPFSLQLVLLFLLTIYSFALGVSLLLVHWQEFSMAIEASRYIHWEWTVDPLPYRGDLEYRWWLKWFWRHSLFGTGYFRGAVRFARGGGGPRPDPRWRAPRYTLLMRLLMVSRRRRPIGVFRDRARRIRIRLRHRHAQRWLRYLLGLCTGVIFIQNYALFVYLAELPLLFRRHAKNFPRPGSPAGRRFGIERDTRLDVVRKANVAGVILVLVVLFLVWGWGGLTYPPGTFSRPLLFFRFQTQP